MSDWLEKVHAHADGELEQADRADVERLLASDPKAAAEHQWAVYLRQTLRTKHVKPDHEDAWRKGVERLNAIDALQGDSRVESFVGRFSWGFAATLLAVIVIAGVMNRGNGNISDQQLAGLFTAGTEDRPVAGADDADTIVRTEVGATLPQIEPAIQITRVGKGEVAGEMFLKFELLDNSGPFQLFMFQGANGFESLEPISGRPEFMGGTVNGQSCVAWSGEGATYVLVAHRSIDEVVSMAARMSR